MGGRARFVPRPVRSWLKRIVHQDELNEFMASAGDVQGVEWIDAALDYLHIQLEIEGLENLPDDAQGERYTFVSNHPLGGPDGLALGKILGHHYEGRIRYIVNDLLMNLHGLAPLFVPVNKTGKQSRDLPRYVNAAFGSPNHIIMFPAGICSRRSGGRIHDVAWNKTFVSKSVATRRDIVPIFFSGKNSDRFYRWANVGKRLGLKFNIAMLFLADEMFLHRGDIFTVRIGRPIPWQTFDASRTASQWAAWVEEMVYQMQPTP